MTHVQEQELQRAAGILQPVDRIQILVLIDNKTDSLSSVPTYATPEWKNLMKTGMKQLSGTCQCCANHGLALIVTAHRGDEKRTVLFDAGPAAFAVEYNGSRLAAKFGEIDAIVLSHGHWDHAGGLPMALDLIARQNNQRRVPCYLHPGMFRERALPLSDGGLLPIREIPTAEELRDHGADPVITDKPATILQNMFFVSGEIARTTSYERGFPGHMRRTEDGLDWEPDPLIMDERFLAVQIGGKGMVVLSACSHAGVINVLHSAREAFPTTPLHAIAGGLHLSGANESVIGQTVADLEQFDLDIIIPGHCTGWRAVNILERMFGAKVVPMAVGMSFDL
ncbi:MAG TPA: MBL fold metallo-hydrolase [Xanthobacteraceae bacterium]|jgi:7,8-dihydropterin-6-yl-methyl-4-(beta-D-ribofuranosyl)aminobenzene 5'-phosphate synthase|nr:MBL fold metallo-hydrolase [Xanthobacteraceae bacterium]